MKKNTSSIPMGILWGLVVSMAVTVLGTVIITSLVSAEKISQEGIGYGAVATLLAASMAGAATAVVLLKQKTLVMCLANGVGYYLCLLATTALLFDGRYQGLGTTALVILGGSTVVALLSLRTMCSPKKHRKKYKIR